MIRQYTEVDQGNLTIIVQINIGRRSGTQLVPVRHDGKVYEVDLIIAVDVTNQRSAGSGRLVDVFVADDECHRVGIGTDLILQYGMRLRIVIAVFKRRGIKVVQVGAGRSCSSVYQMSDGRVHSNIDLTIRHGKSENSLVFSLFNLALVDINSRREDNASNVDC